MTDTTLSDRTHVARKTYNCDASARVGMQYLCHINGLFEE